MSVGDFNIGFNPGAGRPVADHALGGHWCGFPYSHVRLWYMRGEEGYSRFFAYTNLFIASMVVLVLADNLLLMYLGWEGVGLCSLSADRFLLHRSEEWRSGNESVRRDPCG